MSDKQNFQAVINCAAELPVGGYLYPKTALVHGTQLTLSEMLRSTADHIETNGLNADGQLVQVVRVPTTATSHDNADVVELTAVKKNTTPQHDQLSDDHLPFATPDKEAQYRQYAELLLSNLNEFIQMLGETIVTDEITDDKVVQEQFAERFKREHRLTA